MKLILDNIKRLEYVLDQYILDGKIENYLINLPLYMSIEVKLLVEIENELLYDEIFEIDTNLKEYEDIISIEQLIKTNYSDDYIKSIFETDDKNFNHKNFNIRRRFSDLINPHDSVKTPCPVVTFYSYKGGVGRTTLLACCALILANKGKQVIIIDCDFEAPGFTNYFGYRFGEETQQKYGLAEYILDRQFLSPKGEDYIENNLIPLFESTYSYKVGSEYTNGDIRVIKAGNYESSNTKNYLESLARLDISNVNIFQQFLIDLKKAFSLDQDNSVILIDSRTGFNDTFATLYALSQIVVGVFGTNTQSKTGLEYFLNTFLQIKKDENGKELPLEKEVLFVQSFSSQTNDNEVLYSIAKEYFESNGDKFISGNSSMPHKDRFFKSGRYYETLGKIGETSISKEQEIEINRFITDELYIINRKFFDEVESLTSKKKTLNKAEIIADNKSSKSMLHITTITQKQHIIENIVIPNAHAEEDSSKRGVFYFRKGMRDIFNWDKFIISGSKGTGKTFMYLAMSIPTVQDDLCTIEDKNREDYLFINILPIHKEGEKHFNTNTFTDSDIYGINNFFERFWLVYVANKLLKNSTIIEFLGKKTNSFNLSWCFSVSFDSKNKFVDVIKDEKKYELVQSQINQLNQELKRNGKKLIIFFDQLDYVVKPTNWSEGISPLINFWRTNPFSNVLPKIFLRSDLIRSLTAVNSTELFRRAINIEWTKEETFAYFFGLQVRKNPTLIDYFKQKSIDNTTIRCLEDWRDNYVQIPAQREILEPLVEIFFGKAAHKDNPNDTISYGLSYDWFEYNLRDGNNDVSLRPFLWLIEKAKEFAIENKDDSEDYVIGAKQFAAPQAIEYAGGIYYDELLDEEGNKLFLESFKTFLKETRKIKRKGTYELSEIEELLNIFIRTFPKVIPESTSNSFIYVRDFLKNNGIIREKRIKGGRFINYEIPFLYKNYLLFPNA